jgi:phosphatidylglycerol---prolipoprotein diacylglyceryl transferase
MYPTLSYLIKDITGIDIPLPIPMFGLMVAISIIIAAIILIKELKRKEALGVFVPVTITIKKIKTDVLPHQLVPNIILVAMVAGMIGARIFSILEYPDEFINDPWGTIFSASGLTFYGGLILGSAAVLIYLRKHKIPVVPYIDAAAPALILAYGIGRIGCQLAGDGDWGIVNINPVPGFLGFLPDWLWAYNYPHNVINEGINIVGCTSQYCHVLPSPVFPTPLYEVLMSVLIFFFLWVIRKKIKVPGVLFSVYLILSAIERFLIEKIRVDSEYHIGNMYIKQAEIISFTLFLMGAILIFVFRNKYKREKLLNIHKEN